MAFGDRVQITNVAVIFERLHAKSADGSTFFLTFIFFKGDEQLIERLAGLDGINSDPGNAYKGEKGINCVRALAEVSLIICFSVL